HLLPLVAEALAPEVVSRAVELGDESIVPAGARERPAAEIVGAPDPAREQHVARRVGVHRAHLILLVAEALTPRGEPARTSPPPASPPPPPLPAPASPPPCPPAPAAPPPLALLLAVWALLACWSPPQPDAPSAANHRPEMQPRSRDRRVVFTEETVSEGVDAS